MEEHYIECAKKLDQWDVLKEYGQQDSRPSLVLESAWKLGEWVLVKETLLKPTVPSPQRDTVEHRIFQGYLAIHDSKPQEVETLCSHAIVAALRHWLTLPNAPSGAHVHALHAFQRIVELQESALVVEQLNAGVSGNRHVLAADIKSILTRWRERLPNLWDDITTWRDVLAWRQQVYGLISGAFKALVNVNPALAFMGHHETAWSINKFAHVARKHELIDVCLNSLAQIGKLHNIEIQDAFIRLREQVKCYFVLGPVHLRTGLYIINSTNLDYFSVHQKAEFFQLKAEFLAKMGLIDEANVAYSSSVTICDTTAKGWLSWGTFCDQQFSESKKIAHGEYAVMCYLLAVRSRSQSAPRKLARVLWLLSFHDEDGKLAKVFEKYAEPLPSWLWIPWVSQLLAALSPGNTEAQQMYAILAKIATNQPQAIYYVMRTYLLEQRELRQKRQRAVATAAAAAAAAATATAAGTTSMATTNASATNIPSPVFAEQLMQVVKTKHPALSDALEWIVDEISGSLTPKPEEVLLDAFADTIKYCYRQFYAGTLTSDKLLAVVHRLRGVSETHAFASLARTPYNPHGRRCRAPSSLVSITATSLSSSTASTATVSTNGGGTNSVPQASTSTTSSTTTTLTRTEFENDFLKKPPTTFTHMIMLLQKWMHNMRLRVQMLPPTQLLEDTSPALLEFENSAQIPIEIPGQYSNSNFGGFVAAGGSHSGVQREPTPELHVHIHRFHADVASIRKPGLASLRLAMWGTDGKLYPFYVQISLRSSTLRAEERMSHFLKSFNWLLERHIQSKRRGVRFTTPSITPLSPRVRLVRALDSFVSLKEVWVDSCAEAGKDEFAPWSVFQELTQHKVWISSPLPPPSVGVQMIDFEIFISLSLDGT